VYKGIGAPGRLAGVYDLVNAQGWQGLGHTRMATIRRSPRPAATVSVGPDQCLVHNGSFATTPPSAAN